MQDRTDITDPQAAPDGAVPIPPEPGRGAPSAEIEAWLVARDAVIEANLPSAEPPCPAWCSEENITHREWGWHPDDAVFARAHSHTVGKVSVTRYEHAVPLSAEARWCGEAYIQVWGHDGEEMTPTDARKLAEDLNTAAHRCEQIRAAAEA